ncbi:MAG: outer membrane beta-barrel protein [Syntrophothermus sp.]
MKRFLLVIAFVVTTAYFASAQSKLYFGLSGMGISTWITNQNNFGMTEMDYAVRLGFGGNVNIGFDFNSNIGIKTEIGWASLGQKYKDNIDDTNYRRTININYLQIPLLFKYKAGGDIAKFYVAVGPQIDLLLSANQRYEKNDQAWNHTIENPFTHEDIDLAKEDIKEYYQSMDIMGRLDMGVEITLTQNLFLDAGLTFAYGFTDINADNYQIKDSSGNYSASHNIYGGFQVGINYSIPLGK